MALRASAGPLVSDIGDRRPYGSRAGAGRVAMACRTGKSGAPDQPSRAERITAVPHRSRPRQADTRRRAEVARQAAEARRRAARRRRNALVGGVTVAVLAAAGAITAVIVASGSDSGSAPSTPAPTPSTPAAALPGLQVTPPPWQPEYAHLPERLAALNLPPSGNEEYHIHAHLSIFANGKQVAVPTAVGLDEKAGVGSPMHTHEQDGVIHVEAARASDAFTLGAFFDVWGVRFSATQLGGYANEGSDAVRVYVNGKASIDPVHYVLREHDNIVVGYGSAASVPHTVDFTWPTGE